MPKNAAVGIRAHSGWAAVVVVAEDADAPQVISRERISVIDPAARGGAQPYHFAKTLSLRDAAAHIANCAETACRLAAEGLTLLRERARASGCRLIGCGVLTASGRPIPELVEILKSHAMIHTAEGEFFRSAFGKACGQLDVPVKRFRERDLLHIATTELRLSPARIQARLTNIGRDLGPPWTQDQKSATLAALLLLHSRY